jgi:glutathione S-transferase
MLRQLLSAAAGATATVALADIYPDVLPSLGLSKPKNIKLTYFDIPGAGEKVRVALLLGKIPFTDERVGFPQWGDLKPKTPFGQLPLLEVDGETYAQSNAMLQYAGKLAGLVPKNPKACLRVDEAIGLIDDLQGKIRPSVMLGRDASVSERVKKSKIKEMRKVIAEKDIPHYMKYFEKMLENNEYLTGSKPTVADAQFLVTTRYLTSGSLDGVPRDCLEAFPNVLAFKKRMEKHPDLVGYFERTANK